MNTEIYADSISEITLTGSVLRIDFVTMSATKRDANNNPEKEFRQRIIMPIEGYTGSFDLLKRVFDSLAKSGVPNYHHPLPSAGPPTETTAAPSRNSSPNFK